MQKINDWVNQSIFVCFDQIYKPFISDLISDFFCFWNGPVMIQAYKPPDEYPWSRQNNFSRVTLEPLLSKYLS